jgi:ADP-dependent NAD(P)H-hydrate dehydratase / NAD(P)H-hydrate epimerase
VTLPAWLQPLPDAAQMRATDAWAIEQRAIASLDLMERAGEGLTRVVEDVAADGPVCVVVGRGNNGGDGLVTARHLREKRREVHVLATGDMGDLQGDAKANLERLPGEAPVPFAAAALEGCAVVVDAMLGTGFSGAPREPLRGAIEAVNACGAAVVAADVPSGVDASSGVVEDVAVRATATATFHRAKPGLWIHPGKEHAGAVRVIDIGIPRGAPAEDEVRSGLIEATVLDLIPRRGAGSTKFTSGAVLVAGGSRGLTGAPCMASEAAARAGAGYVTVCIPASLDLVFEIRLLEVMSVPLPDEEGTLAEAGADTVLERAERVQALVLGPGLGRAHEFARRVAAGAGLPLLIDADGLNAHAGHLESLASRGAPTILTPHAGELGRLLDVPSAEVNAGRLEHAREAARRSGAIVVLKGDDTLVAEPEGRVGVSQGGSPALATAGTGDVLSGVTGALLAQGLAPFDAACAAVYLHAEAGRRAARDVGAPEGVIASDVIAALPRALGGR